MKLLPQLVAAIVLATPLALQAAEPTTSESLSNAQDDPVVHVAVGIGVPEVLHAELGWHPTSTLSIDASVGIVVFNLLGGIGATYHLNVGQGALYDWVTFSGRLRVNIADEPLNLRSGGERVGGTADALVGYMVTAPGGLMARVRLGALFYEDNGFAAGPLVSAAVGWRF